MYFSTSLVILISFNYLLYTLDYIAALNWSQMYALHGLAARAIQCKVLFVFRLVC